MPNTLSPAALHETVADHATPTGPDLLARWDGFQDWSDDRLRQGVDPYWKHGAGRVAPEAAMTDRGGTWFEGINLASQDYLSLASHPAIIEAAARTAAEWGVHSAGSIALMGGTALSAALEKRLAGFLGLADCTLFPTGWAAGYGVIRALVRPGDHVVMDALSHACLQEGARNATGHVSLFPHVSSEGVARRLARIRAEAPEAGILVVTEGVFSMDSDTPDLAALQALCRAHGATLLVDVAHDLGALGAGGGGALEEQGMIGLADIVMGSFSKSFASNGGFVASNSRSLKQTLRLFAGPLLFSNAMSPIQTAVVDTALGIVDGAEGAERRERLMANVLRLRGRLESLGFRMLGRPSAIVPVLVGDAALSRLATRHALENGALVNLVEYPAVARNASRWRLQVMADHAPEQLDRFADILANARDWAARELGRQSAVAESVE